MSSAIPQSLMCIGIRILSLLWACKIVYAAALSLDLDPRDINDLSAHNSSVNATAREYPPFPDLITCNGYYGVELQQVTCAEALANFLAQLRSEYVLFTTKGPGRYQYPTYLVPVRVADTPEIPLCILTVDLAGQSNKNDPFGIATADVKKMASAVIDRCVGGPGTGGFGTLQLSSTVSGMANAQPAPHGYDAPKFLTVSFTGPGPYYGPGNFDPVVNEQLQIALQKKYNSAIFKSTKDKIAIVINALASVYRDMKRTAQKAWWDNTHYVPEIPQHVSNLCRRSLGHPDQSDCERASFNFIKSGPTQRIEPGKPIQFISGTCIFEVSTEGQSLTTSWDMLRSVADSLMNECLLAPGSPMNGGDASYLGLAQNGNDTNHLSSRDSAESSSNTVNAATWARDLVLTMKENPNNKMCSRSDSTAQCSPSDSTASDTTTSPNPAESVATS